MTSERRRDVLATLVLAAAAFAVYAPILGGGFLNWDDDRFFGAGSAFRGPLGDYVVGALTRVQFDAYHPIHLLSYLPDRLLWPDQPALYHALNVALFALAAALLYRLARRYADPAAAFAAALVFVCHPLATESVAWIAARKDVVALLFFLGGLLHARRPIVLAGLTAAALLTKTSTVCLPAVALALLVFLERMPLRAALARVALPAALAAAASVAVITIWRAHHMVGARPLALPIDVGATVAVYARRVAWPLDLGPIYPATPPAPLASAIVCGLVVVALAVSWRRLPAAARFGAVAFLAALAPVANLVPVYFRFADRYALLALAVLVVPGAIALARLGRPRVIVAGGFALAALAAVGTVHLATAWRDSPSLWAHAVRAQPRATLAWLKLGETRREGGDFRGATEAYQAAIRLAPDSPLGYAGLFYSYAVEAEREGRLPAGTAARWLATLGPALSDERAHRDLLLEVARTPCLRCANSLLWVGLLRFPRGDAELLAAARAALDAGAADAALIYLSEVRGASPERDALVARARALARP